MALQRGAARLAVFIYLCLLLAPALYIYTCAVALRLAKSAQILC